MTPTYSQHVKRYATKHRGRYDRKPYLAAAFRDDARDLTRRVTVPSPKHVAQHLLGPALATLPAETRHEAARGILASLQDRHFMKGDAPSEYVGLWTALNLSPAPGVDFDRDAYEAAVLAAADVVADRDARAAKATAEKAARAVARAAARPAAKSQTERTTAYRAALRARKLAYVRHALAELTADLDPGAPLTRDEVADAVAATLAEAHELAEENADENDADTRRYSAARMAYRRDLDAWHASRMLQDTTPRPTPPIEPTLMAWAEVAADEGLPEVAPPPSISRREAITLARELAPELGLGERRHGNGHRFVYTPHTTAETTQETAMNATTEVIIDRIVAELKEEVRADLAAYLSRRTPTASESLPANVTPIRARRAA